MSYFSIKKTFIILAILLTVNKTVKANYSDTVRNISVDLNNVKGPKNKVFNDCIGAGRAGEGLRADWQQQLTLAQKEIGFRYIRFHGLFNDDMHIYTEDDKGNPIYNWQNIDKLYDFLLSIHIRPFVEFGFMPEALASGNQTVFWWRGNITPPKSYEKWSKLITEIVKHFESRYGKAEVEKWKFEVWNEPNLKQFYSGDIHEYFKMYEVTAKAVKGVSKTYQVGGPATSGSTWIKEALDYFTTIPQLVDFISTHAYGTKSVFDEYGKRTTQMREPDGIPIALQKLRKDVNASALKNREVHITEWNSSPNPKDPLHDTYQNASYLLNAIKKSEHLVNSMSYWTFTDIFEEAGPPVTSFHGGFGLLTLQSIKKPSFMAFKFMNELGKTELLNRDTSSWVCKDDHGNLQALVWNYKLLSPDSSYNQQFYNRVIPAKNWGTVKIDVNHVKNGKYKMLLYKTGYHNNDPYTAYMEMGSPANINLKQEAALKTLASNKPVLEKIIEIKNGAWHDELKLRENDVCFIKLVHL